MPLVTYSALRLGLLAVCFGLGYWAGLRTWLLLVVATFAAWGLSYVLLGGPRDAAARYLAQRAQERRAGEHRLPRSAQSDADHEDAVVDAARSRPAGRGDAPSTAPAAGPGRRPDRDDVPRADRDAVPRADPDVVPHADADAGPDVARPGHPDRP